MIRNSKLRQRLHTFTLGLGLVASIITISQGVLAKTIRALDLNAKVFTDFEKGQFEDLVIEFREGDNIPINLQALGDFLETNGPITGPLIIKRNFWMQLKKKDIKMSLDGAHFKPLNKIVRGNLTAGASSSENDGGRAEAIQVLLQAFLRH